MTEGNTPSTILCATFNVGKNGDTISALMTFEDAVNYEHAKNRLAAECDLIVTDTASSRKLAVSVPNASVSVAVDRLRHLGFSTAPMPKI